MNEHFTPGAGISAAALNRLSESAAASHVAAAGFLTMENGREQVARNPRRSARGGVGIDTSCQWKVTVEATAAEDESGSPVPFTVHVGAGLVAWGGGAGASWEGGDIGEIPSGEKRRVVWTTTSPPRALQYDPR